MAERARSRARACDAVAGRLPAYVAGEGALDERELRHLATCLRCQADVARYRRLLRVLHALRDDGADGALAGLLDQLDEHRRLPWVIVGAAAAAGAGGAAAVLLLGGRRR